MKLASKHFITLALLALPALHSSVSFGSPKELVHLKDLLTQAQVTSGKTLEITADSVRIEGDEKFRSYEMMTDALEQAKASGQELSTVELVRWKDSSRKELLSRIFSKRETPPSFCSSLTLQVEQAPTTPGSRPKDPERARLAACRKAMDGVLGGIMHASPQVTLVALGVDGASSEMSFYVQSVTDSAEYLHYHISL